MAFIAAFVNTVVASLAFVLEYALGGAGGASLGTVFALMVGLHALIGIGEGLITAATVGAVAGTRPDLIYLLRQPVRGRAAAGSASVSTATRFYVGFLVVALLIAGGLSYFASSAPDGLDTVALNGCQTVQTAGGEQLTGDCIAQHAAEHATAGSPLADYSLFGGDGTVGPAGIIGVIVTLAVAGGLFWLLRRRGTRP